MMREGDEMDNGQDLAIRICCDDPTSDVCVMWQRIWTSKLKTFELLTWPLGPQAMMSRGVHGSQYIPVPQSYHHPFCEDDELDLQNRDSVLI
jgi:hypothetical protein